MKPRKKIRKQRKRTSVLDKAKAVCEEAWKQACRRRDKVCQMCGGSEVLQSDHCFSRNVSRLFFDIRNGTLLCRKCHTKKTFRVGGFEKRVDAFVRNREGEEFWKWATETAENLGAYKWSLGELQGLQPELDGLFNE